MATAEDDSGGRSTESQVVEGLVAQAAAGDAVARAALFARYWPVIRQIVRACRYRMTGATRLRETTQDLEQEVAMEVLQALPKQRWQGRQAFKAWLHKLAAATIVDAQRYNLAQRRDQRIETGVERADLLSPPAASPESAVDDSRRIATLVQLLDRLKPQYAGAVMLHHLGYTYAEIGELLGCTAEASRKLVSRGEAKLVRLRCEDDPSG
jgi:RNA polymerase sigma factor (sigma-70 family)